MLQPKDALYYLIFLKINLMTRVSICIATYNGENYIREQLDSILLQLGLDDEIIISDDYSTDTTLSIIKSYNDYRIKLYNNDGRKGPTYNFENAINWKRTKMCI